MKTPESTIKDIMSLINDGEFVHIKCSDHSEKFLHKCGDIYRISTDRLFRSNVTELRNPDDVAEHLEEIRGHGTYAPDDITYSGVCGMWMWCQGNR